jgi:hypothetical protein
MFRGNIPPPSSGSKSKRNKKEHEAGSRPVVSSNIGYEEFYHLRHNAVKPSDSEQMFRSYVSLNLLPARLTIQP